MKKYTYIEEDCADILQLHLNMTYNNFTSQFDKIIENDKDYYIKAEILNIESYMFCLCFLMIRLKIINNPLNKQTGKNIVNISMALLKNYEDNILRINENIIFDYNNLLKLFMSRYDTYEKKFQKGFEYFLKSFMYIINYSIETKSLLKKYPFFEPSSTKSIGSAELYIKTVENIELILKLFFSDGVNKFYENIYNQDSIDYFHKLENRITEYIVKSKNGT
jgi:hypothetical protein